MDLRSDAIKPITPISSAGNNSFWRYEDSGYHTSNTPSSLECQDTPNNPFSRRFLADSNHRDRRFKGSPASKENCPESPSRRRNLKRTHQDDGESDTSYTSLSTPTSVIAGGIKRLEVSDEVYEGISPSLTSTGVKLYSTDLYKHAQLSYPTTPVKKVCKTDISSLSYNDSHLSSPLRPINNLCCPPKRSAKKLSFANNSLPGERLELSSKLRQQSKAVRTIFRPEKKVDIVGALYNKVCCMPAITNIFKFLSNQDIFNFSLVSPTWLQVCEKVAEAKIRKEEYAEFINNTKENYGNRSNNKINENLSQNSQNYKEPGSSLRDIHNIVDSLTVPKTPIRSPPTTPRTRRFRKFTKSASLDACLQLMCARCHQPAKINEDFKHPDLAHCTNLTCSYQFCRHCKCDPHPGKNCFKYDLNGPSPSKRRKATVAIGTKKSKKNLRRLL